ncbi:AP2-like ethylene-responsive transcription factor ANT [Bidens hawaiensis]|uniref:AP2-like ethylene-responsive transcription factor ANT n=1 Tax=Bidens hawaiensis TaxID=980011 RepID=UPI00404AE514
MKSMNTNTNTDNNDNNKNSNNWLGFSLSPHINTNPTLEASHFNYPHMYGVSGDEIYSNFPIMPLKSDGSLCLMEAITRSHDQSQGSTTSSPPKLENFFGGVNPNSALYYNQHDGYTQHQIQHHHYPDYYIPSYTEEDDIKNWVARNYGHHNHNNGDLQLSMSFGYSQPTTPCIPATPQHPIIPATNTNTIKKRSSEKLVDQPKQIVHRKSLDTFGQRTSQYRGVTRHRWTGRYEAHLWDNSCKKEGQSRKGRQVYLGGYDMEEKAARAYDLAALKYWGPATHINFPLENYEQEIVEMKNMSRQEYVAHLRRRSSGFSRGASVYRGVTRHHQHGRWQARIGRVAGNKDLYLGTFSTQEEAAEAYDVAAIKFRGVNAVTNFDISRYDVQKIIASNTLLAGELARRTKEVDTTTELLSDQLPPAQNGGPKSILTEHATNKNRLDWTMTLNSQTGTGPGLDVDESSKLGAHLSNASSLVTSLSSSHEDSPDGNNINQMVLGTPQMRPHIPVFASWIDA